MTFSSASWGRALGTHKTTTGGARDEELHDEKLVSKSVFPRTTVGVTLRKYFRFQDVLAACSKLIASGKVLKVTRGDVDSRGFANNMVVTGRSAGVFAGDVPALQVGSLIDLPPQLVIDSIGMANQVQCPDPVNQPNS